MWADNETKVDLLGFDYLVDSLDVLLTQPGLLPLTVGVLGDWGSGKTSLLQMAQQRLAAASGYLTVFFSPWRYEDYEDVLGQMAILAGKSKERDQLASGKLYPAMEDERREEKLAKLDVNIKAAARSVDELTL